MKKALRPVRKRIRALRAATGALAGLCAGVIGCLALVALSFIVAIEAIRYALLSLLFIPPVAAAIAAFLFPVSSRTTARVADGCGLQERVVTALSFAENDTPMHRLQRADAERRLRALPVREALPIRVSRKLFAPILVALSLCGILLLLPNPTHNILRDRARVRTKLQAQAERIEKAEESIEKTSLTAEERKELRRVSSELARELRTAKDTREALSGIDKLQSDMDELQRQIKERKEKDTQALASQPALKSLADAMQSGDGSQMDQALLELAEALSNAGQKEAIQNQMELAAELAQATEIQQALESAAEALKSGNAQTAMQTINGLIQSMQSAEGGMDALMQMARLGAAQAGSLGANGNSAGSAQGMSGFGSKAGLGTTQRDQGYREGFSQSAGTFGTGEIREKVGNYEQIYDPTRLGGDSEASVVPGEKGEGESQQMVLGPGLGSFEGSVPYQQVVLEYQDAAVQAISRVVLPATQQEWVVKYFDALIE